jgi:hypothetical protein
VSAGIWLTLQQVADLYAGRNYDTARNWVRRDRVEWRKTQGALEVNAETVERYLKARNPDHIRKAYRKEEAA